MALRRTLLTTLAACAAAAALAPLAHAQAGDYPSRPVRLIVPFPPGGATDMVARLLADRMGQVLGRAVVDGIWLFLLLTRWRSFLIPERRPEALAGIFSILRHRSMCLRMSLFCPSLL